MRPAQTCPLRPSTLGTEPAILRRRVSSHLVDQRAQQGVGSLFAEETLSVVQEDLVETVQDVLEQQTALLSTSVGVKQQLV